jgi:hypothetical protein
MEQLDLCVRFCALAPKGGTIGRPERRRRSFAGSTGVISRNLGNIKARAHFLILLTPSALERSNGREIGCDAR